LSRPDAEVLAVPIGRLATNYHHIQTRQDLPQQLLDQIAHFFDHY
jgi:inorganic pyrophosphatase